MKQIIIQPEPTGFHEEDRGLLQFILARKENKRYLLIAFLGCLVQFSIFKVLYPFPDFISDSYSYIDTNLSDMKVNLWPIGYSKFIWFIHLVTSSHIFLVFVQYVLLVLALLYFFYSVLYLFNLNKSKSTILFAFLFFNPTSLYLANCVLSDALFCALSLLLFTQYLWMLFQPRIANLILQAFLVGAAFTIRYTAIYYPVVSLLAISLAGYKMSLKFVGMALPWILLIPFIFYTQQRTKEVTGTAEFSVFGGWQLANNALYMYDHIEVDSSRLPEATRELDRLARRYFREVPPQDRDLTSIEGTFFIKVPNAILKPYMLSRYSFSDAQSQFQAWGRVSPTFKQYGTALIKDHPMAFARHYLWLNAQNYFVPYLEKFGSYNVGMREVWEPAKIWFDLKSSEVSLIPSIQFQGYIFSFYPILFGMLNLYFIGCLLVYLFIGKPNCHSRHFNAAVILAAAFLFLNFSFSVFATPVVLRYQVVPMIILVYFSLLLTERIIRRFR